MSLVPYPLNLSTKEKGAGKTFKFSSFGETKNILYQDLLEIMESHRRFVENGYFFILDSRVVRMQGLDEAYPKILTKDKIEAILSGSANYMEFYRSCNDSQKKIIVNMIVDKLFEDEDSLDLNMVDKISRESGVKIQDRVSDLRESVLAESKNKK